LVQSIDSEMNISAESRNDSKSIDDWQFGCARVSPMCTSLSTGPLGKLTVLSSQQRALP